MLVGVSVLGRLWFAKQASELKKWVETASRELASIRTLAQHVRTLEKQSREESDRLQLLEGLFQAKEGTLRILDSLVNAVPERAWLTELRETEQGLKVSGMAQDGETISNLARELEKAPSFAGVAIDVARQSMRQGIKLQEFSIRAQRTHAKPPLTKARIAAPKGKANK
jgi:Tfp pilus assembly protein PilN